MYSETDAQTSRITQSDNISNVPDDIDKQLALTYTSASVRNRSMDLSRRTGP